MRFAFLCLMMTLGVLMASAMAVGKTSHDPSGTWKWKTQDFAGATINCCLRLKLDGETLTGSYDDDNVDADIENGKFDGEKFSSEVSVSYQGIPLVVCFDGSAVDDGVSGMITIGAAGQSADADWSAKRATEPEDVVGEWELKIVTSNGETLTPTVTLEKKAGKLADTYHSQFSGELSVADLKLKQNKLSWTFSGDYNGRSYTLKFTGIPRGSAIFGEIEYDLTDPAKKTADGAD